MPGRVTVIGECPVAAGLAQVLAKGFGILVHHIPAVPSQATLSDRPQCLDGHPLVIHFNLDPATHRTFGAIDELRFGWQWAAPYLGVLPNQGWVELVREHLEAAGLDMRLNGGHRLLPRTASLADLVGTLAELRERGCGFEHWSALRNGSPHIRLFEWLRSWRLDSDSPREVPLTVILSAVDPQPFFSHETANRLTRLKGEVKRGGFASNEGEGRLAGLLCDALRPILE